MITQEQVIQSLPSHLQPFVAHQDYSQYTPRDQAVWRFLLEQLKLNLRSSAHPTYLEGLERTGISQQRIPRIEDINHCLNKIGWRAVVVDGFLPPAIFMEFQALKVLVIAVNMRSFAHMLYTPAPDIVHESAGHAPFLIDIDYAEFLQSFGELGMAAIANKGDIEVYEAVRNLSIVKETPNASSKDITAAEQQLEQAVASHTEVSESALLTRLHWWTVEYGLVGNLQDYHIYGAGLLSSLGESVNCLDDDKVIKRLLTVDAIRESYDITEEQPQLFVTDSCRHLSQILEEYGRHMCCHRGGASALQEAVDAATVNTATTNSGLQVSGAFTRVVTDAVGHATYFNTTGPTQLCYQDSQLSGHGIDYHAQGYGSPVGRLRGFERCLSSYTVDELKRHHIELGQPAELNFLSGITVRGMVTGLIRRDQKNILLSFEDCTVTDNDNQILFDPAWGVFDMAIGDSIVSVKGGSADKDHFPLYQAPSNKVTIAQAYDAATEAQFGLYDRLRSARENSLGAEDMEALLSDIIAIDQADWLLVFEALDLCYRRNLADELAAALREKLVNAEDIASADDKVLISYAKTRLAELENQELVSQTQSISA
ncbi:MAG: aromatic amino acid hydroxylase [Pseudomonadota bacterium]